MKIIKICVLFPKSDLMRYSIQPLTKIIPAAEDFKETRSNEQYHKYLKEVGFEKGLVCHIFYRF